MYRRNSSHQIYVFPRDHFHKYNMLFTEKYSPPVFFFLPVSFLLSAGKFKTAWANSWISNHFSSKTAISGQIQDKVKPFASEEKGWK